MAALIVVGDDMPQDRIAGLDWPEFLVRRAARAGASHIVLLVPRISRGLVASVDRMRRDGIAVEMLLEAAATAEHFHPDESVLVMSGAAMISTALLERVVAEPVPIILCTPDHPLADRQEVIDAETRWSGIALLGGDQIRRTAAMVGEWDMASTLLRHAVQARARRMTVEGVDDLFTIDGTADAVVASRALIDEAGPIGRGWGEHLAVLPAARALALTTADHSPLVMGIAPWVSVAFLVLALIGGILGIAPVTGAALVAAMIAERGASRLGRAAGLRSFVLPFLPRAAELTGFVALATLVARVQGDHAPLALGSVLVAVVVLQARLARPLGKRPLWLADIAGHSLVIGAAGAFGVWGLLAGLALAVAHALTSLGWLQNKLSMELTASR